MKLWRLATAVLALLALAAGALFLAREAIVSAWINHRLAASLSAATGAEVELQDVAWKDGVLRAGQVEWSGGSLPFENLRATDVRAAVEWKQLFEPLAQPLHVEIAEAEIVWHENKNAAPRAGGGGGTTAQPSIDLLVGRLTLRHANHAGWALRDTGARVLREGGTWSLSARGGTAEMPGSAALEVERISATRNGRTWQVGGFALRDAQGGMLAGSGGNETGTWSGEFSWQDVDLARLLPPLLAERAAGRISGDAALRDGVLQGRAKIADGRFIKLPQFVQMASLFTGENWDEVPWDVFRFDFTTHQDGRVDFINLQAVSPKGLALHGAGSYAPDNLAAKLQLGVARENRPWLVAFMPVIFRAEKSGYLWTTVKISGTPQEPVEDLSARLATAVAIAPATTAVDAAAEIPGAAVDAAGKLLRSLLGR